MRREWNQRARSDAYYYVATGRHKQDKAEFLSTAEPVLSVFASTFNRIRTAGPAEMRRALEIGCGPGRLMLGMRESFGEVHGVDVSDEMIALAREHLREVPGTHAHECSGSDLAGLPSDYFDFVYSYAVFQHIPDAGIVTRYLAESARVLKPGGVLSCQLRGAATASWDGSAADDTWFGCVYPPREVVALTRRCGLHLLQITGIDTQYTWVVARRPMDNSPQPRAFEDAVVKAITATENPLGLISPRGPGAAFHCWLEGFPESTSLERLEVTVAGLPAVPSYISDHLGRGGFQLNVLMPPDTPCGDALVRLYLDGGLVREEHVVRVCEYPAPTPAIAGITDGEDLLAKHATTNGSLKILLTGVADANAISFTIASGPIKAMKAVLYDAHIFAYEFTLILPEDLPPGLNQITVTAPGWSETAEFRNCVGVR
jgi:SAM-dependent methyltransferase